MKRTAKMRCTSEEAPHGWAVVVTTPPPSETFEVARYRTFEQAKEGAIEWAGTVDWTSPTEGVSFYGDRIEIEPARSAKKAEPLQFPRWDEIFETGVFEQWIGPALGFRLNEFGEVTEDDRSAFRKVMDEIDRWLMSALSDLDIQPYSGMGGLIYPSDVKALVAELRPRRPMPEGVREWRPTPPPTRPWMPALAKALELMVEEMA